MSSLQFQSYSIQDCDRAEGVTVVIDVLRAFSTAAYAFAAGAQQVILVREPVEAFSLRASFPGCLLIGEVGGFPIPGFDLGNSPSQVLRQDLSGRTIIQRTSAGTQGAIHASRADPVFAASFCCAKATAQAIQCMFPSQVSFVITGLREGGYGDEDMACADYLQALIMDESPAIEPFLERVRTSKDALQMLIPGQTKYPPEDLDLCLEANRFPFAMHLQRERGLHILKQFHQI